MTLVESNEEELRTALLHLLLLYLLLVEAPYFLMIYTSWSLVPTLMGVFDKFIRLDSWSSPDYPDLSEALFLLVCFCVYWFIGKLSVFRPMLSFPLISLPLPAACLLAALGSP